MTTNVLITGGNRGLGRGFVESFLTRPNHNVIAAVRDPTASSVQSLASLPVATDTRLIVVKIDSTSPTDAYEAVQTLKNDGVTSLDIVIANAAIDKIDERVDVIDLQSLRAMFETNTIGPLVLYKAVCPLLKAGSNPRFVGVSTKAGATAEIEANGPVTLAAYGASKAAFNFLVRKMQHENKWLTAFVVDPGFIQTDMGQVGADFLGMEKPPVPVKDAVAGILNMIDRATRTTEEGTHGFFRYTGERLRF